MSDRRKFFKKLGLVSAGALVAGLNTSKSLAEKKLNGRWSHLGLKTFPWIGSWC